MSATFLDDSNCDPGEFRANLDHRARKNAVTLPAKDSLATKMARLIVMCEHYASQLDTIADELRTLAAAGREAVK